MYYDFFGLNAAPFKITPDLHLFYSGGRRGDTLEALEYAVLNGEGIIKVVGEVGSGKTMLCRMLESRLPETVETIYITTPSMEREEILYALASELGIDPQGQRSAQVVRSVQEHLISKYASGRQVVVFIDEAQAMPLETLEEIRLLSNLETSTHKLLQIVLFGQPELDEHLSAPHIRQLRERITHSFNLGPFSPEEVRFYLQFRMRAVGYKGPDVFSKQAIKLIAEASHGLIRRVNILADKALLAAFSENIHEITAAHAKAAIQDSGFKPAPPWKKPVLIAALASAAVLVILLAAWRFMSAPAPQTVAAPRQAEKTEAAAPATSQAKPLDFTQKRLLATETWLAHEEGGHYTIQIDTLAGNNPAATEAVLSGYAKAANPAQLYAYRSTLRGQPMIGITYGNYADATTARAALKKLPPALRNRHPLLRTIEGIRSEINQLAESQSKTPGH